MVENFSLQGDFRSAPGFAGHTLQLCFVGCGGNAVRLALRNALYFGATSLSRVPMLCAGRRIFRDRRRTAKKRGKVPAPMCG
jgi:hypothetical protein